MLRMSGIYWKNIIRSPAFYFSILLTTVAASFYMIMNRVNSIDVVNAFEYLFISGAYRKILPLFAAFPFVTQFCKEWNSKMFDSILIRSHLKQYLFSNCFTCVTSSFSVTLIGLILFIATGCFIYPMYISSPERVSEPYGIFLQNGFPFIYMLIISIIYATSCSLWTMCGFALSSIFPNTYVALCSPFICSYLIEQLTDPLPDCLDFYNLAVGKEMISGGGVFFNLLYNIGIFMICIVGCSLLFRVVIRKRVYNEIH